MLVVLSDGGVEESTSAFTKSYMKQEWQNLSRPSTSGSWEISVWLGGPDLLHFSSFRVVPLLRC